MNSVLVEFLGVLLFLVLAISLITLGVFVLSVLVLVLKSFIRSLINDRNS